ncbi:MAG TPA: hypothetical protein VFY71_14705, partial [Planctomycetota bacterium]|nr:hypothetical protein [Planctomycetota bacterium]
MRFSPALLMGAVLAGVLAATPAAAQGALWIVDDDGGPGVDATDIQAAIDAAADGDVILVRSGVYSSLVLDGRSLSVIGEDGEDVELAPGTVSVAHLAADQRVLLRGLDVVHAGFFLPTPSFRDCAGAI